MALPLLTIPLRETLGLRVATGTILGLAVLMFLMRLFSSSYSAESGVGNAYLQGKYSLGGCSEFSAGSQFFLGLIFYAPVFFAALALLLSTFFSYLPLFGESKVLGFSSSTVLLAIGAVGVGGLFIMPANAARVVYSVEIAPVIRSQLQNSKAGEPGTFLGEGENHFRMTEEQIEKLIEKDQILADEYTYAFFSLKFFGWYLYLLAYAFCMLLSFKVLEFIPESEEDEENPEDPEVKSIGDSIQRDIDEFNKTIDFDADFGDFHDFTKDKNFGIKTASFCDSSDDGQAKTDADLVVGTSAHDKDSHSKSPKAKSAHIAPDLKSISKQSAVVNTLKTAFGARSNSVCSEEKVQEQSETDTRVIEI